MNSSYHPITDGGRTDGWTDGRTKRVNPVSTPPSTLLRGYKNRLIKSTFSCWEPNIRRLVRRHLYIETDPGSQIAHDCGKPSLVCFTNHSGGYLVCFHEQSAEIMRDKSDLKGWSVVYVQFSREFSEIKKANLRDLIAATGLVIFLKFDPNHRFFSPCDLEIWWMTLENNRAPLLYYIKLCASFQIHRWIETEVTVRKHSIRVKIGECLSCVTLEFDEWPWKTIGHLFYTTPSFAHHFKSIGEFKLELQSGNAQFGSKWAIFCPV